LSAEVINFRWFDDLNQSRQTIRIGEVCKMECEPFSPLTGILMDMIDATGVKGTRPPNQSMDLITFVQQQFRKIRPILASNPGNQSALQCGSQWCLCSFCFY
jgi:hypothetical protein